MKTGILSFTAAAVGLATAVVGSNTKPFTPVDMLSAPRPHIPVASPDGTHAINVVDQWWPHNETTTRTIYMLHPQLNASEPKRIFQGSPAEYGEFIWLSPETVAYLNGTTMYHFQIKHHNPGPVMHLLDFPKSIDPSSLQYDIKSQNLVFNGAVWLENEDFEKTAECDKKFENRGDTGQLYDSLYVRHWDTWRIPGRVYTLGMTHLERKKKGKDEEFSSKHEFINLLKGTKIHSQMDVISDDQISISSTHVAFALKPPHLNVATHTRMEVYLMPFDKPGSRPAQLTPGNQGAVTDVEFSPDGTKVAWLEQAEDGYESDKRVVVVHTLREGGKIGRSQKWTSEWNRSPQFFSWALDSKSFYVLAEYNGRVLPYHLSTPGRLPTPLLFKGSISSIQQLRHDAFLLSSSSIQSPMDILFLDLEEDASDPDKVPHQELRYISNYSKEHIDGRLDGQRAEELWFAGADGRRVMGWVIKPRGWSKDDKAGTWPMAFLIHGGPQGAWTDSWSTRWNPAVYASMGYFVVAINPTGSTGYGQEFTDRIKNHWGDRPYQDLLAGYQAALSKYTEIDPDRTVALGASYGGYMINWINGHNIFGFKALVYHDGILDTTITYYETEEVFFPTREFEGSPTVARANYERWNPMNHVGEWSTPQLVIQGGKDYRLPESQAIGTFTALQLNGVPSRFLYFPDENHWVLKAANSKRWHYEVFRWLDEWVGHGKKDATEDVDEAVKAVEEAVEEAAEEVGQEAKTLLEAIEAEAQVIIDAVL